MVASCCTWNGTATCATLHVFYPISKVAQVDECDATKAFEECKYSFAYSAVCCWSAACCGK